MSQQVARLEELLSRIQKNRSRLDLERQMAPTAKTTPLDKMSSDPLEAEIPTTDYPEENLELIPEPIPLTAVSEPISNTENDFSDVQLEDDFSNVQAENDFSNVQTEDDFSDVQAQSAPLEGVTDNETMDEELSLIQLDDVPDHEDGPPILSEFPKPATKGIPSKITIAPEEPVIEISGSGSRTSPIPSIPDSQSFQSTQSASGPIAETIGTLETKKWTIESVLKRAWNLGGRE